MAWEVEYTDEFGQWWESLTEAEQVSVAVSVQLLEERWYEVNVPLADRLYDEHVGQLRREGLKDG